MDSYLQPGNEYLNVVSFDLCAGGPGGGPFLGLCATTPPAIQLLIDQVNQPLGTFFHFVAPGSRVSWGPLLLPPTTVDAVCVDITGGTINAVSSVRRITIQ